MERKMSFDSARPESIKVQIGSANIPVSLCHQCLKKMLFLINKKFFFSGKENAIGLLKNENAQLISTNQKLDADLSIKTKVVAEIQNDKKRTFKWIAKHYESGC